MARLSLCDEDRERLGCPEWIEVDLDSITIDESIEIYDSLGLDPVALIEGWTGNPRSLKAVVWLALRRADVQVPIAELTFKSYQWTRPLADPSPGKGRRRPAAKSTSARS